MRPFSHDAALLRPLGIGVIVHTTIICTCIATTLGWNVRKRAALESMMVGIPLGRSGERGFVAKAHVAQFGAQCLPIFMALPATPSNMCTPRRCAIDARVIYGGPPSRPATSVRVTPIEPTRLHSNAAKARFSLRRAFSRQSRPIPSANAASALCVPIGTSRVTARASKGGPSARWRPAPGG